MYISPKGYPDSRGGLGRRGKVDDPTDRRDTYGRHSGRRAGMDSSMEHQDADERSKALDANRLGLTYSIIAYITTTTTKAFLRIDHEVCVGSRAVE